MSTPVTRQMIEEYIEQAEKLGDLDRVAKLKTSLENFKETPPMIHEQMEGNRITVSFGGPPPSNVEFKRELKKVKEGNSSLELLDRLLVDLHTEIREGRGDGEKADNIRDEMDKPWYQLTYDERVLHNLASADLYQIGREEIQVPLEETDTRDENTTKIMLFFVEKRWIETLRALQRPSTLSRLQILKMRASCYSELGLLYTSHAFDSAFRAEESI